MKIYTRVIKAYEFTELSEEAKERARNWYLDDPPRCNIFTDYCNYDLEDLFPNSELQVQYSLGYCQGDGLNIYGALDLRDALEKVKEHFTEKELKYFNWAFTEIENTFEMPQNWRAAYCICDRHCYFEDILYYCENHLYRDIPYKTIEKLEELLQEYFTELCGQMEKQGYKFLYEADDAEIKEVCEANNWLFDESGDFLPIDPDDIEQREEGAA